MELSLSQVIGLVLVGAVIIMALGFSWYGRRRFSHIYSGSIQKAVVWGIALLIMQTVFLLVATANT